MLIFKFIIGCTFGYLLNEHLQTHYSDLYKEYSFVIMHFLLRFYSKLEIQYNKYKNLYLSINNSNETKNLIDNKNNNKLDIYKNGLIHTIYVTNENLFNDNIYIYSKLLTKETNNDNLPEQYFLKKILKTFPNTSLTIEESSINFILVEIIIGEHIYNIKMKDDMFFIKDKKNSYSYYVVDNVLDKNFFIYYFNTHTNYEIEIDKETNFVARIIDHNVVTIELDLNNNDTLKFTKDDYLLHKIDMIII